MVAQDTLSPDLLDYCRLLRCFDSELLAALTGQGLAMLETMQKHELVMRIEGEGAAYRLRDEVRAQSAAQADSQRHSLDLTRREQIFVHLLGRIVKNTPAAWVEAECLYQLEQIFLIITSQNDLPRLLQLVAQARPAGGQARRLARWLDFYEGFVAVRMHDYPQAAGLLTPLLAAPDLDPALRLQVLNALGNGAWMRNDFDFALEHYTTAQQLARTLGNRFYDAAIGANMALIHAQLGAHARAHTLLRASLAIFTALGDQVRAAHVLYELGNNEMQLGQWAAAQQTLARAAALHEALGLTARLAHLYWAQGFMLHMLGNAPASEQAYRQAQAQAAAMGDAGLTLAADSAFQLGLLYQSEERWGEARAAYCQALRLARKIKSPTLIYQIQHRCGMLDEQLGRPARAYINYRTAIAGIERLRVATSTEEFKLSLVGTTQQVYEAMVLLCLRLGRPAEAFAYVERARSRAFLDALVGATTALARSVSEPVATLAQVQAALPAGALLIEYYTVGVLPRGEHLLNRLPPGNVALRALLITPPQLIAFAITRDALAVHQAPFDANRLRPLPGDPLPTDRLRDAALLARLHAALIAFATPLAACRLLYLVPHGPLHHVPFMALHDAAGRYLLAHDGPAIALAPSASILLRRCLDRVPQVDGGRYALGYNATDADQLRYAEAEARYIAQLVGGQAWAGPQPKTAELLAAGPPAQWLHIAGHATYDPHDPLASALQLGEDETLSARTIIERLQLQADLVTLSACASGVAYVAPGDELLGLQRALLYAGAAAVVCTLWETRDLVSLLVMDQFYRGLLAGATPAEALRDAQVALRELTGRELAATLARWRAASPALAAALADLPAVPAELLDHRLYADPAYWAAFVLIGRAD